jgi:DNA-binding response OmpR family regulator
VFLGEQEIEVSVNEFEVLWLLASRAGEVVSRSELIANLRGFEYDGFDRSMDIRISRLRRKLEGQTPQGITIKTVRGKGYLFSAQAR